jgi:hypothetical protein
MPAGKICARPGCPHRATQRGRCDEHRRADDRARGTSTQRGFGTEHQRARRTWEPRVATGTVRCCRCRQLIAPGTAWALDHNADRTGYLGPAHGRCNASAAGRAAHGLDAKSPEEHDYPG